MTGGEIIGIAGAAGKAILGDDASTKAQMLELARDSPAMKAAAQMRAQRIAARQALWLKLWKPVGRLFGLSQGYFQEQFAVDMAEALAGVPEENVISPRPIVAMQAVQGLSYSLDEPDLKKMYLDLLATASDSRVADSAHPSFAEIIRQLTSAEARLLKVLGAAPDKESPVAQVRLVNREALDWTLLRNHLVPWLGEDGKPFEVPEFPVYADNWVRLGLVQARYDVQLHGPTAYDWVETRPEFTRLVEEKTSETHRIDYERGVLMMTDFGRQFATAVGAQVEAVT